MARTKKRPTTKKRTTKRRRTRLGDTPAGHREKASHHAQAAIGRYDSSRGYAEAGQCEIAFTLFAQGAETEGKAIAHDREAYGPMGVSESGRLMDAQDAAAKAFARACIVQKRRR